ncbi:hypothetical protein OXX80_004111, partial [Metschnikowia pulcherrima]
MFFKETLAFAGKYSHKAALPASRIALASRFYSAAKTVPLTAETYSDKVQRNPNFKTLEDGDLTFFRSVLKDDNYLITNEADLDFFNEDWMRKYKGQSKLVLKPKTTEQVSQILKYC